MTTKVMVFEGLAAWARVYEADDTPWGERWSIDFYPDDEDLERFKGTNCKLGTIRKTTFEGKTGYKLRRPTEKMVKQDLRSYDPPLVVDAEGKPTKVLIGNGSRVKVKVAFYETKAGVGHRLEAVKILELIPYGGVQDEEVF